MRDRNIPFAWTPLFVIAALAMVSLPGRAASDPEPRTALEKLDRVLRAAVDSDDAERMRVRVLVRATGGDVDATRAALEALGHDIWREFRTIGALGLRVRITDLLELAAEPSVASVSSDGPIGPDPVRPGPGAFGPGRRSILIRAVRGHVPSVLTDLRLHRDIVTHTDLDAHTIAANVHAGDVDVLARHPAVESIEIAQPR